MGKSFFLKRKEFICIPFHSVYSFTVRQINQLPDNQPTKLPNKIMKTSFIADKIATATGIPASEIPSRFRQGDKNVLTALDGCRAKWPKRADEWETEIALEIPEAETGEETKKPVSIIIPDAREETEEEENETEEETGPVESVPVSGPFPNISIMGQDAASFALQGFINDFCRTGEFPASLIITAPAGGGKSHTFNSFVSALEKAKPVNVVSVETASEFATIDSDGSQALLDALRYSSRGVHSIVKIDEAHLIGKCGAAMKRVIDTLIYGAGQGWKRSGSVTVGTGKNSTYRFDTRFLSLVLITNFPEKIMKGNREAMERRFKLIALQRYSAAVMRKLIPVYFKEKRMKVEPDALTQLLKIHRGTLEALDNFREMASGHHDGTITKEVFERVLPICKFTLRGFTRDEVKALKWIAANQAKDEGKGTDKGEPRTRANILQNFPSLDVGAFYRHCKEQETKGKGQDDSIPTPFLVMDGIQYAITETAKTFLSKNSTL